MLIIHSSFLLVLPITSRARLLQGCKLQMQNQQIVDTNNPNIIASSNDYKALMSFSAQINQNKIAHHKMSQLKINT